MRVITPYARSGCRRKSNERTAPGQRRMRWPECPSPQQPSRLPCCGYLCGQFSRFTGVSNDYWSGGSYAWLVGGGMVVWPRSHADVLWNNTH
jgi:hypothetical protein